MARVAVIIPIYNRAHLIGATLDSVLAQTFDDLEVVVVDDGSTDGSAEVVTSYGDSVRLIPREHSGNTAITRNIGISATRSEYLAFVDSDDVWMPGKLARQISLMESDPDCSLVFTDADFIDPAGYPCADRPTYLRRSHWGGSSTLRDLYQQNFIASATPLVRRAATDRVGVFDPNLYWEDYDLWLRIAATGRLQAIDEVLASMRLGPNRKSSSDRVVGIASDVAVLSKFQRTHPLAFRRLGRPARRRLSDSFLALGIALHDAGRRHEALSSLRKAARTDPTNGRTYLRFALLGLPADMLLALSRHKQRAGRMKSLPS